MSVIYRKILEDYLMIKKGEEKKVLFFLLFFALLMMAQELGGGISLSIFLSRAGIGRLPLMLLLAAVMNFLAVISYVQLSSRRSNKNLFALIIGAGMAVLIPSRLLAPSLPTEMSYFFYAVSEFMTASVGLHFSVYLSDFFDTRQSKRLFPIIFAGSRIGGITGGLVLGVLTRWMSTLNMTYIWIFSLAGAWLLLLYIDKTFPPQVFDYEKQSRESSQFFKHLAGGMQFLRGSRLLKALTAGLFLLGFLSLVLKFLYSQVFVETFPNEDQLTVFYGLFTIAANVLGIFIQLVIANRLIDSLGLGISNSIYAVAFSLSFAGMGLFYGFPSAVWARFTDEQLESAIRNPVEGLLYNAIPDSERARARALSSGLITPLSAISGSIVLEMIKGPMHPVQIAVAGLLFSLIYIYVAHQQNKGYVDGLMQMVKERTLSLDDLANLRWEKASRKDLDALYALSCGEDLAVRGSATTLLLHLDEEIDFGRLSQSFFLWTPDVQEEFLKNYFRRQKEIDRNFLLRALGECQPGVKVLIIEFFIETADEGAGGAIRGFLSDGIDLHVQNSAIRYFYLSGGEGRQEALKLMEERFRSPLEAVIRANLAMIRDLYDETYLDYVKKLMEEPNKAIAIDAVNTLGVIYQPLGREEGEIQGVVRELMDRGGFHELRAAATILGKRVSPQERELLLGLLDTSSAPLRDYLIGILVSNYPNDQETFLQRLEFLGTPLNVRENLVILLQKQKKSPDGDRLKKVMKDLVGDYFLLILEQAWLRNNGQESSLMLEINERKKTQIRIIILELLEALLHQKVVVSLEKALLTKNPRLISNAMELFENLWDKKQAKSLITLLYPQDFEEDLKTSEKFLGDGQMTLEMILGRYLKPGLPRWDVCASLLLLGSFPGSLETFDITPFLSHGDPLVREIAQAIKDGPQAAEGGKMLTTIEKVICLKNAPIFKSLKMDELKMVAEIARERTCAPMENVIEKGEVGSTMFIIASGEVEVYLPGSPRKALATLGEAEFFGEMALFRDDVRSASIMTLKPTQLLCIERDHFFNLIYEKPEISIELIRVLSERLHWMDQNAKAQPGKQG